MWDRLATAEIPYTRPRGTPPASLPAKRRFLDKATNGRLAGITLDGKRALSLAGGGGWEPILFAELGADTTVFDISAGDRKSTRLNSSHGYISYAVFCLKKKKHIN